MIYILIHRYKLNHANKLLMDRCDSLSFQSLKTFIKKFLNENRVEASSLTRCDNHTGFWVDTFYLQLWKFECSSSFKQKKFDI